MDYTIEDLIESGCALKAQSVKREPGVSMNLVVIRVEIAKGNLSASGEANSFGVAQQVAMREFFNQLLKSNA